MACAAILLFLSLSSPARAQDGSPPVQKVEIGGFTDGLFLRNKSNSVPDRALTEALNVLLDEDADGVVVRRQGRARCNVSPITNSKRVRGLWKHDSADGSKYQVALSSISFYEHDGDCDWQPITGLTDFSPSADFDCVSYLAKFWCIADGETMFYWDPSGTPSTHTVTTAPAGSLVDGHRNRIIVGDVDSNQSRLYLSAELDGTDWVLGGQSTSPAIISIGGVNDGNSIKCLMGAYSDTYLIGKQDNLYGLYGFDQRDFRVREISHEVGCIDDRTPREKNGSLYWLSTRGIERLRGNEISRVSDPIRSITDDIIAAAANLRTALDSTQANFEAGDLDGWSPGAPMSATISNGNLVPSTFSWTDTTAANFSSGTFVNISTENPVGSVTMSSTVVQDMFADGNYTSSVTWTVTAGVYSIAGGRLRSDASGNFSVINTTWTPTSGSWSFKSMYQDEQASSSCGVEGAGNECWEFRFAKASNGDYYAVAVDNASDIGNANLRTSLIKNISGVETLLSSSTAVQASDVEYSWKVERTSLGKIVLYFEGAVLLAPTAVDTSITSSTVMEIYSYYQSGVSRNLFDDIDAYAYPEESVLTSREFDTGFSTPTGGPFTFTMSSAAGETSIYFDIRATDGAGAGITDWVATSDTLKIPTTGQYWQYRARFSSIVSSKTARLDDITLSAATTGQFISQCREPGTEITSWGRLSCDLDEYDGTWTIEVGTGTTCNSAVRSTTTWNAHNNNSVINLTTAPFVAYRLTADMDVFYSTRNPTVHSCQIGWNEGESRPALASAVHLDRYHLAYTTNTEDGSVNDHVLVLDRNDKWVLWDGMPCYSMNIYERAMYCGDSGDTGLVHQLYSGTSDDGAAFTSRFKTKAYSFGRPDVRREFMEFGAELEPEPDSSYNISGAFRYYLDRSTVSVSIGPVDMGEDPGHLLWAQMPFPLSSSVIGRYLQLEAEVSGTNVPFRFYRGFLKYRPLRED